IVPFIFGLLIAYFYFCGFHYLRGLMVGAKEKNIAWWRIIFVLSALLVTVVPAITAFAITLYLFPNFWFIALVFSVASVFWAYGKYNLLSRKGPLIADWAMEKGLDRAASKLKHRDIQPMP